MQHSTAQHSTAHHRTAQQEGSRSKEGSWTEIQLRVMSFTAATAHQAIDDVNQAYGCHGLLHPRAAQHQMLTAQRALGSNTKPYTHWNFARLYSSRYFVSSCGQKPMLICPWQLCSREPSCLCLQIEGCMRLTQQLLTIQHLGHIAVFLTSALAKNFKYHWMQLARHHSTVLVAILLQCCVLLCRCCAVQRMSSWHTISWMGDGWTAGAHTALQQCRQATIAHADRGSKLAAPNGTKLDFSKENDSLL